MTDAPKESALEGFTVYTAADVDRLLAAKDEEIERLRKRVGDLDRAADAAIELNNANQREMEEKDAEIAKFRDELVSAKFNATAWHRAMQAAATCIEVDSNGSPKEMAEAIRSKFDALRERLASVEKENRKWKVYSSIQEGSADKVVDGLIEERDELRERLARFERQEVSDATLLRLSDERIAKLIELTDGANQGSMWADARLGLMELSNRRAAALKFESR